MVVRKFKEKRPHGWQAGAIGSLRERVDIGDQPIAQIDCFRHGRKPVISKSPGPSWRIVSAMRAHDGDESGLFDPSRVKLRRGSALKSTRIMGDERHPGQTPVEKRSRLLAKSRPGRVNVPGPCCRTIVLHAGGKSPVDGPLPIWADGAPA